MLIFPQAVEALDCFGLYGAGNVGIRRQPVPLLKFYWLGFGITAGPNHALVLRQIRTNISITGTSINTPITVAKAAPEESPNSIVAVAIATSK